MAKLLKFRIGVSDDPTASQPSLNDCLEAVLRQADKLMAQALSGLASAASPANAQRMSASFKQAGTRSVLNALTANSKTVCADYHKELARLVYGGGGKEQAASELLRFEDLHLFEDAELDLSIEVARALQEVQLAVDDAMPALDALMSALLGWRTIQPGLNPIRPEIFVRALQSCLAIHVPQAAVREALIAPAAGLLGVNLAKLYRELSDWLRSCGIEPAVPAGRPRRDGTGGPPAVDSVSKTLLTLDRLRQLLAGDFDPVPSKDFMYTVPASMDMLQDMNQVDALMLKLERRSKKAAPQPPVDMLARTPPAAPQGQPAFRLGLQLGEEVVRLMFDNLAQDRRLLPEFKRQLKIIEPVMLKLAQEDSRFFSDRKHSARQFLDRITQRSLAFSAESEPGFRRFMVTVEDSVRWLESKIIDADIFDELLQHLQDQWADQDQMLRQRREDAARALLHAEQRNLLAQKLAAEFSQQLEGLDVPDFVGDFLRNSWAQVVAETQLSYTDGSDDPFGYRAMVEDMIWSVQKSTATRGRAKRLVEMIPGLLAKLQEGLSRIEYPSELTARFLNNLITIHRAAVHQGRDAVSKAAADNVESELSEGTQDHIADPWLDSHEVEESGFLSEEALAPVNQASLDAAQDVGANPARVHELRPGAWVELMTKGKWVRVQLTWASPHATLFMFTSLTGAAFSMSRRMVDRLRAQGHIRIVAERNLVDEALDQVAQAALKNSLDSKL